MGIGNLMKKIFGPKPVAEQPFQYPQPDPARIQALEALVAKFGAKTAIDCVELTLGTEATGIRASKVGGQPYLPPSFEYPRVRTGELAGRPLRLLAQINFAELPPLEDFPTTGILQFYACDAEGWLFGADMDQLTNDNAFRVIYQADISAEPTPPPALGPVDDWPVFADEFALTGVLRRQPMTTQDFRFWQQMSPLYQAAFGTDEIDAADDIWFSDALPGTGHRLGGYPFFTQNDPREPSLTGHTTLLLQLDTGGAGDKEIMWGDAGVGNFFIEPERLRALDFSNVVYTWDCC